MRPPPGPGGDADSGLAPPIGRGAALVVLCSFLPLLAAFLVNLWTRPLYRFFPLALAGAAILAWRARPRLPEERSPGSRTVTFAWIGLALGLLAVATMYWSPWTGAVGAWCALAGVLWWMGGWGLFGPMFPALLMVAAIIPLPLRLDAALLTSLGWAVCRACSRLLYEMDVPHVLTATGIEVPHLSLPLNDVLRPMEGFFAVCAFGLFWVLVTRRRWWQALLTLLAAPGAALLAAAGAVTLGVRLSLAYRYNCFEGARGVVVELGVFAVAAAVVMSFDQWLRFLTAPAGGGVEPGLLKPPSSALAQWARRRSARPALVLAAVFATGGALQLPSWWLAYERQREALQPPQSALPAAAVFDLPATLGEWRRASTAPPLAGELLGATHTNRVWHFDGGDVAASVSLDGPFRGFSDGIRSYLGAGWRVYRLEDRRNGPPGPFIELEMQRRFTHYALLRFGQFDESGQWLAPPSKRPGPLARFSRLPGPPAVHRVQVLLATLEPLTDKERAAAAALWDEASRSLREQALRQLEAR